MNATTLFMVPLRVSIASTRRYTFAVMGLMLAISVVVQILQSSSTLSLLAPIIAGLGEFFVGMLFVAPFLLVAIDTKQLRVPRSQSTIVIGMLIYSMIWIGLPSVALTLAGASFLPALAIQTSGLCLGLMFGLLPRGFVMLAGFASSLIGIINLQVHPEKATMEMLWLSAVISALVAAFCWRRIMRMSDPYGEGFNKPFVVRSRGVMHQGFAGWGGGVRWTNNGQQLRSLPQWMHSEADLRNTGPEHPVRSLRIILGGWMLPKTWQSTLRQWLTVALPALSLVIVLCLRFPDTVLSVFQQIAFSVVLWIAGFGSMFLGLATVVTLQQRWSRPNAELPLLALLPGIGDGQRVKTQLLRASLAPLLYWQLALTALLLIATVVKHPHVLDLTVAAVVQIVALTFAPAFALAIFGGRPLLSSLPGMGAGVTFGLIGCSLAIPNVLLVSKTSGLIFLIAVVAFWLSMLGSLLRVGMLGRKALNRRPHPFLIV